MTSRLAPLAAAGIVALLFDGCVPSDDEPVAAAPSGASAAVRGLITAAQIRELAAGEPANERFSLSAIFARRDASPGDEFERLASPRPPEVGDLAADTCTPVTPVLPRLIFRPKPGERLELLDIGDVSIALAQRRRVVPTRTFPDLMRAIVGVSYMIDDLHGLTFRPGEDYRFVAGGLGEVEPFAVTIQAPADLGEIRIGGQSPGEQVPLIAASSPLEVSWEGDGWGDEVVLNLSWTSLGTPYALTCRMKDDGFFTLRPELLRELSDHLSATDETLTLTRVRQVSFRTRSVASGNFAFTVGASFSIRF